MAELVVLVNGLPGSGKSTLASTLAGPLAATIVAKDAIKEALADTVSGAAPSALGAIAMDAVWSLAAAIDGTVIIDAWLFAPRDTENTRAGLDRIAARRGVELWCDVPVDVARRRYATRRRHPVHRDRERLAADWDAWARHAAPLGILPCVRVDTARPMTANHEANRDAQN